MAWTTTDLDRVDAAIANCMMTVEYSDGHKITYDSTERLIEVRNLIRNELSLQSATPPVRQYRVYTTKGW